LLDTFLALVAIDSPTGHEQAIGADLEKRFGALGCEVRRDKIGNLIATLPGDRDDTLLLSFHMDTAGTDTGIKPQIRDGVIYSDGTTILGADDKSGLAQVLELLELLKANPDWSHPNLEIVVSVGEEQGLLGSRALDTSQLKATWGMVYDAAGGVGAITYWAPTTVYLTVVVHGKKVHAGVEPEKGINAVKVAAEAIANMPLGRIDEETVANIGTIEGGEARNIVPGEVKMAGMARSHDQAKLDAQVAVMEKAFAEAAGRYGAKVDFAAEEMYRTYKIEPHDRPYREAARAIESLGIEVIKRKSGGGTDGNLFNAAGIPCVAMCTGMVDEHANTEHISIADLVTAAKILVTVVTQEPSE
ncbi:MAG TPA: M20/M25/M40 family metallo-hydrolase, partial [Dehalococcoidia bacterium]|nr:M20/M25/M40 family metallo-hydrolase [Dehalococcoidia bacterium]